MLGRNRTTINDFELFGNANLERIKEYVEIESQINSVSRFLTLKERPKREMSFTKVYLF